MATYKTFSLLSRPTQSNVEIQALRQVAQDQRRRLADCRTKAREALDRLRYYRVDEVARLLQEIADS